MPCAEDEGVAANEAQAGIGRDRRRHPVQITRLVEIIPIQQADERGPRRGDGAIACGGQAAVVRLEQLEAGIGGERRKRGRYVVGRPIIDDNRFSILELLRLQRA